MFILFSIGEKLGQPSYAVPYLAPNASGEALLNGVNYASGGGGILNATGSVFVSIFVPCTHYLSYITCHDRLVGRKSLREIFMLIIFINMCQMLLFVSKFMFVCVHKYANELMYMFYNLKITIS